MKDKFVNLHVHSTYSFLDGYGTPSQYAQRVKEIGQPAMAITDHGNISAHYKWYEECNKAGVKPILGCEFYIVDTVLEVYEREYGHITVLAKNNVGYRNLTKLVTKSWCEQFYYKPRITLKDLEKHKEGLIILSGCLSSPVMKLLRENKIDEAKKLLKWFNKTFDDFYVEAQAIVFKEGHEAYERLLKLNDILRIPMVVTTDCHYVKKEHAKVQEVMLCIQCGSTMDNEDRMKFDQDDFYLKTREEVEESMNKAFPKRNFSDALDNTVKIAESIEFTFPTASPVKFPMDESKKTDYFKKICRDGLYARGLGEGTISSKEYQERLEYEMDLIIKKNFVDYFLVISDVVTWAKKEGILVGPARGSAAGSLCCYALRITEVEPIQYGLIFERFIDINREDLPDIDLDFQDDRRHEVKNYLTNKYGKDHVGNLPTFSTFKGKSCIQDVAKVYRVPFDVSEKLKSLVIERSGGDSRASLTIEDTFNSGTFEYPKEALKQYPELKYSIEIEGQIRNMSQHAAGVVISNEPITDFCAIYSIRGDNVLSLDYHDAVSIGLLKIDVLGLSTLTVISKAIKLIEERTHKTIKPYEITFDDPKVYQGFKDEKLFGIFQFAGNAVHQVCRQIQPDEFSALYDINALARPGPLNSGSAAMYIRRRDGREGVDYPHALMKPFTEDTYGIVIYQEQVMQTMRHIGKMSWKDTAEIRKLISKSQGVEKFNTFKEKFTAGAKENGMTIPEVERMWESICTFGSWAFNKSHSVSYSFISYWTMYLKIYYPIEFYSAILSNENDKDTQWKIIKEYKREGFKVLPLDINRSKISFGIDQDALRIGFSDIKSVGEDMANKLIAHQPYLSFSDFQARIKGKGIGESKTALLNNLGAFDNLSKGMEVDLFGSRVVEAPSKEEMSFAERFKICPWDMEFTVRKNWQEFCRKHIQMKCGCRKCAEERLVNPDSKYGGYHFKDIDMIGELAGADHLVMWGIAYDKNLKDVREMSRSKGKEPVKIIPGQTELCSFTLEDDTGFIIVRVHQRLFHKYKKLIFEDMRDDDVLLVRGKIGLGIQMLFADEIYNLRELKQAVDEGRSSSPEYRTILKSQ